MSYDVIGYFLMDDLVAEMNRLIGDGWKPLGAPFWDGTQFYQAILKEDQGIRRC